MENGDISTTHYYFSSEQETREGVFSIMDQMFRFLLRINTFHSTQEGPLEAIKNRLMKILTECAENIKTDNDYFSKRIPKIIAASQSPKLVMTADNKEESTYKYPEMKYNEIKWSKA